MDIKWAKQELGLPDKTPVHFCEFCHKVWHCDCNMCNGEHGTMCLNCWGIYTSEGKHTEDPEAPPILVQGQYY